MFDGQKCTAYIHGVRPVPERCGHVPDWVRGGFVGNTCIGAEDVDRLTEMGSGFLNGGGDGVFVADVTLDAVQGRIGIVCERVWT